jgi:DNA-binding response OmpR family regulator
MGLPRILIVDDDRMIRTMVREAVEELGFDVQEAKDGREGLHAAQHSPPQLIILDVQMPHMDGYAMCEAVRRLEPTKEIPVLILTVHGDAKSVERAFEAGATDFISKPFDQQILQHRVLFMMRASNAFAELRKNRERLANAQRLARVGHWEWDPRGGVDLVEGLPDFDMQPLPGADPRPVHADDSSGGSGG